MRVLVIAQLLRWVGRSGSVNWLNHTSWVAVVTKTDRPKSVSNRSVIGVFVLRLWFLEFSVGVRAFFIEPSQISSFYSNITKLPTFHWSVSIDPFATIVPIQNVILCQNYMMLPLVLYLSLLLRLCIALFRVAVIWYQMICLVLVW